MSSPVYTGYVAFPDSRSSSAQTSLPSQLSASPILSGKGNPESSVPGVPGQKYTDILTLEIYVKIAGTQTLGWQKVGIALGMDVGAVDVAQNGSVWAKLATGWVQLAGG